MPKAFCRACLTFSKVSADQVGQLVVCPVCRSKFTVPRAVRTPPNPVSVGIGLLAVAAVGLVIFIKVQKSTAASKPAAGSQQAAHEAFLDDPVARKAVRGQPIDLRDPRRPVELPQEKWTRD